MGDISQGLIEVERQVAENFVAKVQETNISQIIYLGGILDEKHMSPHLSSRLLVENVLRSSGISTTVLRASIIIGAGSASFEIIRNLVEKLPIMVAPRWVHSFCQPIAVLDVIFYLQQVLHNPKCYNRTFDIGGPNILSFKKVMLEFARIRHLKRFIIEVPVLTPRLSSYWLVFITSVRYSLSSYLVESMKSNSICRDRSIDECIPHQCLSYEEAVKRAFVRISQNEVFSTWMDSWDIKDSIPDIQNYIEVPMDGCLSDIKVVPLLCSPEVAMSRIWSIGGANGWYCYEWAWDLRGFIDKMLGGVGMNRGRRHPTEILVGDSIDFWRVLKAEKNAVHLILFAEMKVPGEAWLEFTIQTIDGVPKLIQKATFRPKGLFGRLYWYSLVPVHYFIFGHMAKAIAANQK